MKTISLVLSSAAALLSSTPAVADDAAFTVRSMTPETAPAAARAALDRCRKQGYQVSVAVVDRAGLLQVLLRDRFAGPHTVDIATRKAWTSASFRMATSVLAEQTQPGSAMSGLRSDPHLMVVAGGQPIEAGGSVLGAIGVSGAPGGDADDGCARAGIQAVADALEF